MLGVLKSYKTPTWQTAACVAIVAAATVDAFTSYCYVRDASMEPAIDIQAHNASRLGMRVEREDIYDDDCFFIVFC
jgi:hypothetical protein